MNTLDYPTLYISSHCIHKGKTSVKNIVIRSSKSRDVGNWLIIVITLAGGGTKQEEISGTDQRHKSRYFAFLVTIRHLLSDSWYYCSSTLININGLRWASMWFWNENTTFDKWGLQYSWFRLVLGLSMPQIAHFPIHSMDTKYNFDWKRNICATSFQNLGNKLWHACHSWQRQEARTGIVCFALFFKSGVTLVFP